MRAVLQSLRTRALPALLTGLGGVVLMAGLLSYTNPAMDASAVGESPTPGSSAPTSPPTSALPTLPSVSPSPSGASGAPPSTAVKRLATRVVVPALGIDLPVVKPPGDENTYPLCNVAMYIQQLHQPGEAGATYLYAHARTGMFLPLLDESQRNNGKRMIGMLVQVYTSDDQLFLYSISEVRRHVLSLDPAIDERAETLWLQTSEGPHGTPQKLQVVAQPLSSGPADHADAHPTPHPVVCG
ncbi:MAG TPA: sortase [Candidatus Limnocylindrales bacterium]|nr:sortase [Candidatus Limnocylindrales bacterium]